MASIHTANGDLTKTDQETAETFCNYFGAVFTKEDAWNHETTVRLDNDLEIVITEERVLKALRTLKPDKSPGPDNIHAMVLKEAASEVVKPLTMIFHRPISQGELPDDWKKRISHRFTRRALKTKRVITDLCH